MTQPAELAMSDVATDGLEVKAVEEVLIADVSVAGVPAVDTTHRSDPIHVETMNTGEEHFGKGPGFTAVEQDVEYKAGVDGVFGGVANFSGVEDALLEVAKLLRSALEALVYVNSIAPISSDDPTAQVLEAVYYGDGGADGVDDVCEAVGRVRYCDGRGEHDTAKIGVGAVLPDKLSVV